MRITQFEEENQITSLTKLLDSPIIKKYQTYTVTTEVHCSLFTVQRFTVHGSRFKG